MDKFTNKFINCSTQKRTSQYDKNFDNLEKYIQSNYKDGELIDFEGEQRRQ